MIRRFAAGFDAASKVSWLSYCRRGLSAFPPVPDGRVNPYWFVQELCSSLGKGDTLVSSPIEDMSPFLSREELAANLVYPLP